MLNGNYAKWQLVNGTSVRVSVQQSTRMESPMNETNMRYYRYVSEGMYGHLDTVCALRQALLPANESHPTVSQHLADGAAAGPSTYKLPLYHQYGVHSAGDLHEQPMDGLPGSGTEIKLRPLVLCPSCLSPLHRLRLTEL